MVRLGILAIISFTANLCACTSPILDGSNGIVRCQQYGEDKENPSLELVLVQETHKDCEKILSERRENYWVKMAPTDLYAELIKALVDETNFLEAVEASPPLERNTSSGILCVENEYGKWTMQSAYCDVDCDSEMRGLEYYNMVTIFRHFFDNIFTLQLVENHNKGGAQFFREEQERLKNITKEREN